jgi:prepilin-type N-terminal cleavage/methylation domain-containing protein
MARYEGYPSFVVRRLGPRLRAQVGYTLIELMTVLGVVSVLIAIAAPTVASYIALQEVRGARQEVVQVLRDARDAALNEGVPRYVLFSPPRSYQVFRYDDGWVADGGVTSLGGSVSFATVDVTFPQVNNAPETGGTVPVDAAYFDTRGRYPFDPLEPTSYTITLQGGLGRTAVLTVWRNTGQVTQ